MKYKIIAISSLVIVAAGLIIYLQKCTNSKDIIVASHTDSTVRWSAKDSVYVSSLITEKDQRFSNMQKTLLDSIAKIYKTTSKQVNELLVANVKGESEIPIEGNPSIDYFEPVKNCPPVPKRMTGHFKNKWYDITARVGQGSSLSLKSFDTLTVLRKTVTTGNIFNRKIFTQVDISLSNPYNIVSGIRSFIVPAPKPKKVGIGLFVGYGLNGSVKPGIIAGVGVSYNIIRF